MNERKPLPPMAGKVVDAIIEDYPAILQALDKNTPSLSDAEIDEIADRVAQKLIGHLPGLVQDDSAEARWKAKWKKLGYDTALSLLGSGIWAALVYAASRIQMMDSESRHRSKATEELQQRFDRVRRRLGRGLVTEYDHDSLKIIDETLIHLPLSKSLVSEDSKSLIDAMFRETREPVHDADRIWSQCFFDDLIYALRERVEEKILASDI